jgi:hypothetical protein
MRYLKSFNENGTSATGGLAIGRAGEVFNRPTTAKSDVTPNSIGYNTGSVNMNNTLDSETYDVTEEEPNDEVKDKQKKKSKIQKELEEGEEKEAEKEEQPIMNWDSYVKTNINKIQEL